jgi:hypothetical protein
MNDRDEEIAHLRRLQAIHRKNLAHYQQQARAYGGLDLAPSITRMSIEHEAAELRKVAQRLRDLEVLP